MQRLFLFFKNFAKTIEFPYGTPGRGSHFKTTPGYKLAKMWLLAVPVLEHCHELSQSGEKNHAKRAV